MACLGKSYISKEPLRKNKYDPSVIEHWVETSWSGEIIDRDLEREIHEKQMGHDGDLPNPNLDFETGPKGPHADEGKEIMGADVAWLADSLK